MELDTTVYENQYINREGFYIRLSHYDFVNGENHGTVSINKDGYYFFKNGELGMEQYPDSKVTELLKTMHPHYELAKLEYKNFLDNKSLFTKNSELFYINNDVEIPDYLSYTIVTSNDENKNLVRIKY